VSSREELSSGQATSQPLPVLPLPEVPGRGHGEGGGANSGLERPARPSAHKAQEPERTVQQPVPAVGLSLTDRARLH